MVETLEELEKSCNGCTKCKLCQHRTKIVFGVGKTNADIMLIGEGPGADEDAQGEPFVGKAGKLMNEAFRGTGINRNNLYITNVVKCRPPQNRDPEKDEIECCKQYLENQIQIIKPKLIVLLGKIALQSILGEEHSITRDRGTLIEKDGITYLPMWHPAALLRDDHKKIQFWQDCKLMVKYAQENELKH